jgi:hypothetical protein
MLTQWKLEDARFEKVNADETCWEDLTYYLRENGYPLPVDCPGVNCEQIRPGCKLGICKRAVEICGDF